MLYIAKEEVMFITGRAKPPEVSHTSGGFCSVYVRWIKPLGCYFLLPGFDCKISLTKCNDFFSGITVLHYKIAGITRKPIIRYRFCCSSSSNDFVDLNKMGENNIFTVLASNNGSFDCFSEISPFLIF